MNQVDIVQRAFRLTWRNRALWVFGILLALTGGGFGGGGGPSWRTGNVPFAPGARGFPDMGIPDSAILAGIIALCCCLLLILAIVAVILRYVARTALYRMVDRIEGAEASPTWRDGFRLGWDHRSFRLFLLDLVVGIPFAIVALVLIAIGASPLVLLATESDALKVLGIASAVGLLLLIVLLIIIMAAFLSLLTQFWSREIVLQDRGIGTALSSGYRLARGRLKDTGAMWLLMLAIAVGYGIAMLVVGLTLFVVGAAIGGGLGWLIYLSSHSVALAAAIGVPLFLLFFIVPLVFVSGIYKAWESGAWTLAYREIAPRSAAAPSVEPVAA